MSRIQRGFGLVVLLAMCPPCVSWAQEVLKLEETDDDAGTHTLDRTNVIADVFSTITIQINKDALRRKALPAGGSPTLQAALDKAEKLHDAATNGLDDFPRIQQAFETWVQSDRSQAALERLSRDVGPIVNGQRRIFDEAELGTSFRDTLKTLLKENRGKPVLERFRLVFEAAAVEAESLRRAVDDASKQDGIYVQMGAWIGDRPQHLEGFDDYPMAPTFDVQRWQLALTDGQKQQLKKLEGMAGDINKAGLKKALEERVEEFSRFAPTALTSFLDTSKTCLDSMEEGIDKIRSLSDSTHTAEAGKAKEVLDQARDALDSYRGLLDGLKAKYAPKGAPPTSASELLVSFNTDLLELRNQTAATVEKLKSGVMSMRQQANTLQRNNPLKGSLTSSAEQIDECLKTLGIQVEDFTTQLGSLTRALFDGNRVDVAILAFGKEVLKLDLATVPDQTTFALKQYARVGENLTVKLAVGRPVPGKENSAMLTEIERQQFVLFKVLPHVDMAVNVIFAHHDDAFQAAPSYSWLFKVGSRKRVLYNRLLDFGIGINVSALDFNHDDTPEIGTGLVVSAFRDYLQAGYGYNIGETKAFYFFGIKLPVPTHGK